MSLERKKPLRADPEKTRDWQRRSRSNLPAQSAKRKREAPQRKAVREVVLARDQGCQARGIVPGRCWHPRGEPLDVHEVISRGLWAAGYLDPGNCLALCRGHHEWVTAHRFEAEEMGLSAKAPQPGLTKVVPRA